MVDISRDKASLEKLADGVWVDVPDFGRLKIRRYNNREQVNDMIKLRDQRREELKLKEGDELPEDDAFAITIQSVCDHVIMDWEGVEQDGKPVKYTPKMGFFVFGDKAWEDIFLSIVNLSTQRSIFLQEQIDSTVKNH